MNKLQNLWHRLTVPCASDADEARQEHMTKVILVILSVTGVGFFIAFIIAWVAGVVPLKSLLSSVLITIFSVGGWWLAYRGHWRVASYIPTVAFFALALRLNYESGLGSVAMLVYTLVILLVAMLQGSKMQWVALGLSIGAYLGIGWMYAQGLLPPPAAPEGRFLEWAIPVSGMLVFITTLLWFHTSQLQGALRQAHQTRVELAQSEIQYRAAIESMDDALYVVDANLQLVLHNTAFEQWATALGVVDEIAGRNLFEVFPSLPDKVNADYQGVFDTGETLITEECTELAGKKLTIETSKIPIFEGDKVIRVMTVTRDITERKQAEEERGQLQQEVIEAQKRAIQELSTPVIPIMDRIIVMPLIGSIDSMRAKDITRSLLAGISAHQAKVVILDVTGVPIVDSGVANHLNKTIQAARLKGARTIVTGISDAVAEAIVDLGIDWSKTETLTNLQTGLVAALNGLGIKLNVRNTF